MANTTSKNRKTGESAKPPVAKLRIGLLSASIWERTADTGTFHSVTFERRYRDGEGNWKSSHSYTSNDLLALGKAADLAHTKIVELRNSEME